VSTPTRPTLADALTGRLLDLIRDGGLVVGDRLPPARELAARFEVATPTVREALRRLEATGAVELRHGSGVYVGPGLHRVVLPNPHLPSQAGDRMVELLEARLLIEPALAERAAQRRDVEALANLRACLEDASHRLGSDTRLQVATMGFHAGIAAASGNSVLHEVVEALLAAHAPEQRRILELFDDRVRDHEEHLAILAAIEHGRPSRAAALMRAHLTEVRDTVRFHDGR
jgi:GntR family transcriptional repressor for pyruvate dehydrogenase complex